MAELQEFKKLTARTYSDQAKFFLNAFWKECSGDAEIIWKYCVKIVELDTQKGKNGCDLDEFSAHRFLEQSGETKRVVELRESLRSLDLDNNKRMALIEFLLFRYKQTIKELLSRPQGESEELNKAEENLRNVQDALQDMKTQMAELKKEEDSTNQKMAALEKKANDPKLGQVQRNGASNELEQLKKGDNIRIRKGKVQTATKKTEDLVAKAQKFIQELQAKGGLASPGTFWWMERELTEAKKYLPQSKQK
eukprot:TRINITY_DN1941_c0_g1_i1.p1 TRINITY_DN1941_c0_g1~~TRINITY_DN1941_c0_g1_i1.p1  ORF type:complete len:251 (-),score=80.84 TRINITY_DN1941_c0_g1_i1:11-763(-)